MLVGRARRPAQQLERIVKQRERGAAQAADPDDGGDGDRPRQRERLGDGAAA